MVSNELLLKIKMEVEVNGSLTLETIQEIFKTNDNELIEALSNTDEMKRYLDKNALIDTFSFGSNQLGIKANVTLSLTEDKSKYKNEIEMKINKVLDKYRKCRYTSDRNKPNLKNITDTYNELLQTDIKTWWHNTERRQELLESIVGIFDENDIYLNDFESSKSHCAMRFEMKNNSIFDVEYRVIIRPKK